MLHIAVVDDDYRVLAEITEIIRMYYKETEYEQFDFSNGLEFVHSLEQYRYDIVFMDIEMEFMNGAEAIKRLREKDKQESTYVIFISSHTDHLIPLFSLHPYDYLVKPFDKSKVMEILSKITEEVQDDYNVITLTVNRKTESFPVSDIMVIESMGHFLKIAMKSQTDDLICYMKLSQLEKKLGELSSDFLRIHVSFLVNRRYITKYTQKSVFVMDKEYPISLRYRERITEKIHERL